MNIQTETVEQIEIITMNRPERRNALALSMMNDLTERLTAIGADSRIRAVILASHGPAFSAGHDLSELVGRDISDYRGVFAACTRLMTIIQEIPQPVIAEVQGIATAAGCQLVATCDLAIAVETAKFATPGVRIGLFCTTPMVALTRAIGRKRALEMLLTGKPIDAATAQDWGLINRVVSAERLREETLALARQIIEASSMTLSIGKHAFYEQIEMDQADAYSCASEVMTENAATTDAQEGMSAFLQKREPKWQHR